MISSGQNRRSSPLETRTGLSSPDLTSPSTDAGVRSSRRPTCSRVSKAMVGAADSLVMARRMDLGGPRRYGPKVTFTVQSDLSTDDGSVMTKRNDSVASCPQVGHDFSQTDTLAARSPLVRRPTRAGLSAPRAGRRGGLLP